jgi:hypothetical protein
MSHVPALRHVKDPSTFVNYGCAKQNSLVTVPAFAGRGLARPYGAWRLYEMNAGTCWGNSTIGQWPQCRKAPLSDL